MKIYRINNYASFTGVRQDRNAVEQLKKDNAYDLNLPNQRRISNAIDELSKVKGEDNINFLLDVSEKLRYGTNIDLDGKKSYNDWRAKLNQAALKSYNLSDKSVQERLAGKIDKVLKEKREITPEEQQIMAQRGQLLSSVDVEALQKIKNPNMKNLKRNLDYFIVSSEVPTAQKLYILKRLNYLMSDDYKINPQLSDKKTQVLSEIVNDIVINTPESKIPNIKIINQRQHGMCAAISVCRKALAYEDKANYVDMVLSELDDSDYMQVYDRSQLGQHKKIPIPKAYIDYDYALEKGYRIVDASVMNWMNAADTSGAFNDVLGSYSTFDKEHYGTFADSHIHKDIDEQTEKYQDYYRACKKSKDAAAACKRNNVVKKYFALRKNSDDAERIKRIQSDKRVLHGLISQIAPTLSADEVRVISNDLTSLSVNFSDDIAKMDSSKREFAFIPNEEDDVKQEKIKNYLNAILPENKNSKVLNDKVAELLDLAEDIQNSNKTHTQTPAGKYMLNKQLFDAAAAYRTQNEFSLDIPENLYHQMIKYNIPDNETYLIDNLHKLSESIRSGKINPELKEQLYKNFASEIQDHNPDLKFNSQSDKVLAGVLDEYADSVNMMMTTFADDIYRSLLAGDRKTFLSTRLKAVKDEIDQTKDKEIIQNTASVLKVKPERKAVSEILQKYIDKLEDEKCTDQEYFDIMNKCGHKSNLMDMKGVFDNAFGLINEYQSADYIAGFNVMNGASANADLGITNNLYAVIAKSFNNMSMIIKTLQDSVQIYGKDGSLLNSADPKYAVLKKLENSGEIATDKELRTLQRKFDAFYKNRNADDGSKVLFKDMPKYLTTFTPFEKEALNKYRAHINSWYSASSRDLNDIYKELKEPLEELSREIGVQKGEYWTKENDSGLMENQAVKIFEHMTDRPYYKESNTRRGVEKIKNSPYSGSSMSSVSDTEAAMHAQYVADVKPVTLTLQDTSVVKDAIFHDNTWGAAEHENVWKDKYGLTRTDYSNEYGGQLGYITNEMYQNGKLAENLIDRSGKSVPHGIPSKMYRKLAPGSDEEYTFQLLRDFILQGVSPSAMTTAKSIKQNILLPSSGYVDELSKYAQNMSRDEINAAFKRIETAGNASRSKYKEFLKQIQGDNSPFNRGIDSQEKYDKLPKNDKLRLMCEKVAIIKSYDNIPNIDVYHMEVKSQKDIKYLQEQLRKSAKDNFDYVLGKNDEVMRYGTEKSRRAVYAALQKLSSENGLGMKYEQMVKIANSMKKPQDGKFDGSISHTTDLMTEQFAQSLKAKYGSKLTDDQIKQTADKVKSILNSNFKVSANDVKAYFSSGRNGHLAAWIDREFAPETDEEFAEILSKLRNMTTEEFNKKYSSTVTDEDMGINKLNGYDIVKMIRSGNSSIKNSFINTIFSESYYKDIQESKVRPYFDLKKYSRNLSSGTYVGGKRSFDDLYSDFYYSLSSLETKKAFDKYKDEMFRKYFVFPAYPMVQISSEESLESSLNTFYDKIDNYMSYVYAYKNQEKSLNKITELKKYTDTLDKNKDLTQGQYEKIVSTLDNVLALNKNDETFKDQVEQAQEMFQSGTKSTAQYSQLINSLYDTFKMFETTADNKTMSEAADIALENIDVFKKTYVMNIFEPKYQSRAFELLNKWISARSKAMKAREEFNSTMSENSSELSQQISEKLNENLKLSDEYYNQFKELFYKHRLLETPEHLLKEYLLLCAKDARTPGVTTAGNNKEKAKEELNELRSSYKDNLSSLLYMADMQELQTLLMDCASEGNLNAVRNAFKSSTIELKNGTVVPMDSDDGLRIILSPMLAEKNLETAALFLNQLGLSERVCDMLTKDNSLKEAYKCFDRIQSILKSTNAQVKFAQDEFKKLGNFDNDPNAEQIVEDYRQRVIAKINKTNFRASKDIFNAAIDDAIKEMKENPQLSKTIQLGSHVDLASSSLRHVIQDNIDLLQQPLRTIQVEYDLLQKLQLPENSPVIKQAEDFINKLNELLEYENNHVKAYPYIGIEPKQG